MLEYIKADLTAHIDSSIVNEILEHHNALKTAFRLQDWEKCLVRGGKFAEAVIKALHFIRTGIFKKQILVDSEIKELNMLSDLPEWIRLLIPRAVRVLYDHRSRRGGAHGSFEPNAMDCCMVVPIADWILGELVRIYCITDTDLATKFVIGITSKSVPVVERIGEDYVVLKRGLSARQEIGYILYSRYPERTTRTQLGKWITNHSSTNITNTLSNMRKTKLVHYNNEGAILTVAGLRSFEDEISHKQDMVNFLP